MGKVINKTAMTNLTSLTKKFREQHLKDHPNCTYGDQPHFVPPSSGEIGFFLCDPPKDLRNHTRCRPPFDHEHPEHHWTEDEGRF